MDSKRNWLSPPAAAASNAPLQAPHILRIDIQSREVESESNHSKWSSMCGHFSVLLLVFMMALALLWTVCIYMDYSGTTAEQRYGQQRATILALERRRRLGGKLKLTAQEHAVNARLLASKTVDEQLKDIWHDYQPRPHFLSKYRIAETDLYEMLRSMPKGGLLHVHDAGMFKSDLLIELSYRDNLWTCVGIDGEFEDFRFSARFPHIAPNGDYTCSWQLLSNFYEHQHINEYLAKLRASLSLDAKSFANSAQLARHMQRAHRLIHGLITFRPIWPTFIQGMLEDFYADGVNYVELRSSLPVLYDLNNNNYTIWHTARALVSTTNIFRSSHLDFIGIKLIYAPVRDYNDSRMNSYIENARILKEKFPSLFVGFDLISYGNECQLPALSRNLQLLHISKEIDFYFHAGESRCFNSTSTDENLVDALLLGSKRIGNPLNMPQHPELFQVMRLMNVAIEVCPLSNYHMQYVNDLRLHPAAYLLASGYPIVVGSDYPYFWNAAPLTDDFYVAFVGIATGHGNLRLLKQLAMNSLLYSALNEEEKRVALQKWRVNWNQWVNRFANVT